MSHTISRKKSFANRLLTFLLIALLFVMALSVAGCSTPAAAKPDPAASQASTPTEEPTPTPPPVPAFGETVTYSDGLSVSVSQPAPYTPTELAAGVVDGQPVLVFEFVITNNSAENFEPSMVLATVASGGQEASAVFDTEQAVGFPPTTTILPGQTVKWTQAWSVADPNNLTMEVSVGILLDPVIFTNVY